ncbi:hypothetical protein CASFOL_028888 [Castilleja foliolosa]|uniref:Uncharacterized protein n=1 Tax=Castilleja foliolosa TaxID=1961234 RepID=A0ABD3CCD8_9LAMI
MTRLWKQQIENELPENEWFCSRQCSNIHSTLQKLIEDGEKMLPDDLSKVLKEKNDAQVLKENREPVIPDSVILEPVIRWRLLSGKSSSEDTRMCLSGAVSISHVLPGLPKGTKLRICLLHQGGAGGRRWSADPPAKMFRGNNSNNSVSSFLDNHFQYPSDMSNQLNLCVNAPANFHADNVTYLGKNHVPPFVLQNRCGGDFETIPSQRKIKFNLNNGFDDEPDRKTGILNQNPVSTGLRLSYDVDEQNSSISSASGSFMPASSIFSALGNDINREIDQQNKELDLFIRIQSDNTAPQTRHFKESTHRNSRNTNN